MKTLLEMKRIEKEFSGVHAVKNVDFVVREGEVLALVGENGAGKSTLVKILSGAFPREAYRGDILIDGEQVLLGSVREAEKHGIAMIPQELQLVPGLSVGENIYLNHEPVRRGLIDWDLLFSDATADLESLNLHIDVRAPAKSYGIAVLGLVSIAKALSKQARILILDEPTSALTEEEVEVLFSVLRKLKQEGITSIFISHKIQEIMAISDRIAVMRDGQMVDTLETSSTRPAAIIESMIGRKISQMYPKEQVDIGGIRFEAKNFTVLDPKTLRPVVKNVSFSSRRGEVLGVFGLVGSGRTELSMAIFGHVPRRLYTGEVFVDGERVLIGAPYQAMRHGIGFVTEDRQKTGLFFDFDVKFNIGITNLEANSGLLFIDDDRELLYSREYVEKLSIKVTSVNQMVGRLSGGNQQKVVIAKWLGRQPRIMILDEPTRGIDVGAKVAIYRLIGEMARAGVSIVFISSETTEVLGISDRIIVMHRGEIKGVVNRGEADDSRLLHMATGGLLG